MASQRDNAQVVRQPGQPYRSGVVQIPGAPGVPQVNINFPAFPNFPSPGAGNFEEARRLDVIGGMAMTTFDLLSRQHDEDATRQAREDAPALIKYDGQGMLVPVSSFEPSGFTSRAYRQAFEDTGKALYMQTAAQQFGDHVSTVRAANPTDIGAVQAGIAEKKTAMMQNLDPGMSKLLMLRFNAIEGQALSATNANIAQERLAVSGKQADNALGSFINDAAKSGVILDKLSPEDLSVNNALLASRWQEFTTLAKGAGWSDARIAQTFEDSRVKIYTARHAKDIGQMTFDASGGAGTQGGAIMKSLTDNYNLPPVQASAIVGGLFGESNSFDPTTVHDNGTGYGIAGWRLERRDAMIAAAKKAGVDPSDRGFQIDYLMNELKGRPEFKQFMAAKDPAEAMTALMHFFRPKGYTPENPTGGGGYESRVGFANALLGSGGEPGQMDLNRMAQVRQKIDFIAEQAGAYAPQVRQALQAAMADAVQTSQLRVSAFNQNETNRIQKQQLGYIEALQTAPEGGVEIRNTIRRDVMSTLTDSSLSDAGKLKAVAMFQQTDALTVAQAAPFYGQQVTKLVNTMQDVSQPVERQRAALNQLSEVVNDPSLSTHLPLGVRNYAETAIRQAHRTQVVGDVAGFQAEASSGRLSPEIIADRTAALIDRGVIGDGPAALMNMQQGKALYDTGVKAWTEAEGNRQLSAQGLEQWRKGRLMPSQAQADAIAKTVPFRTPDGAPFSLAKPEHQDAVANYLQLTGTMPAAVKDQFANVPMGADPETTMAMHGGFKKLVGVLRNKPGMDPNNVYPYLAATIGTKPTGFLADVSNVGYEAAVKYAQSEPNAVTRQQGDSPGGTAKGIDTAIDKFVGEMPAQARQDFIGNIPFMGGRDDTTKLSQELMTAAGQGKGLGNLLSFLDPTDAVLSQGVTELKMAPALRAMISRHADNNLQVNGRTLARFGEEGARMAAVRTAMQNHRDLIDVIPGEDGKSATLGLKSWSKQTAELLQLPGHANARTSYGMLKGIVETGNTGGQVYDPGSLQAQLNVSDYGERFWSVTGTQSGVPVELEKMPMNDPRLGGLAKNINEEASRYMRKHWMGKGPGPSPEEQAWFGSSAATLAINTMNGIGKVFGDSIREGAKERMAGEWVDPTWLDKMLMTLGGKSRNAPVGSTDWKATIENARKNTTAEDRVRFQRLEALTRSIGSSIP